MSAESSLPAESDPVPESSAALAAESSLETAELPAPFHMKRQVPGVFRFLSLFHDRNPFYLFSALSMVVGFRVVLAALNSAPADWKKLLLLIATLHLYEVVMIALALFLIVRRGLRRDGWILLGLESLFLVDLTNLNAELFTAMPRMGSIVNSICFALAMMKIGVVIRVLKLRPTPGTLFYIAAQLAFLFGLPGIFWLLRSPTATVSAMQIYGVWWMVGLLIAAGSMLVRRTYTSDSPLSPLPWRLYIVVPLVSLLVHLASENRVFWVHFHPANIAPLLLASVVALSQSSKRWHPMALPWSLALLLLAVVASIAPREYQHELTTHVMHMTVSPLRVALLASMGLTLLLALKHFSVFAAHIAAAFGVVMCLGATPGQMLKNGLRTARATLEVMNEMIPDTAMQWGCLAIVSSFLLLGIGALVSLKRVPPAVNDSDAVVT